VTVVGTLTEMASFANTMASAVAQFRNLATISMS
jgi:hypothetical protein